MMDLSEARHIFIVRIWLEEMASDTGRAVWRGQITHQPDGHGRYFQDPEAILTFIVPYLGDMQADLGIVRRIWHWLDRWRFMRSRRVSIMPDLELVHGAAERDDR